jgi:hypothetical protein
MRIESYLKDGGSLVIQSIAIVENGVLPGLDVMGYNDGFGGWVLVLFCWQVPQPLTYCWIHSFILGHQYRVLTEKYVEAVSGWPAVGWS